MAITYKSQGAGVATETSGAACSPLCPATVDAGDVLIAHAYFEGTTTAPDTPANWSLLDGPRDIGTTVVARHWVYGKIADGTEDGAAVAFGSQAVTTMRAGRVYSFAGRVSGTITELVNGFAATAHATDPQMPTVTTTAAGALAVGLVGQNDNNAQASPTGETGGDWVEAVAEFTAALTPGLALAIETCTPTADPGTVSGGSIATTNDPCGVIGFQIKTAGVQDVPQTIAATQIGLATVTKAASFPRTIAATMLGLATVGTAVSFGQPIAATVLGLATILTAVSFGQSIAALMVGVISTVKEIGKSIAATVVGIANLEQDTGEGNGGGNVTKLITVLFQGRRRS